MTYKKNGEHLREGARLGLGCAGMSNMNETIRRESMATIDAALNAGVTFLNTADFYEAGQSEMIIGDAIKGHDRDKIYLSLKFGAMVAPNGSMYGMDVRPLSVKNYLTYSLKRLKVDYIDLYQPARIDLDIPVEETIGAISELVQAGFVRHVGITQVDAETLKKAHATHPIRFIETEYSLFNRKIEKELLPVARELGIGVVAFGVMAHGMLAGTWTKERIERAKGGYIPLFYEGNIEKNVALVDRLREIAVEKQTTVSQLAYAWLLSKGMDIIPLIGTSKPAHFEEAMKALDITLNKDEIERIELAIPEDRIAGASFPDMRFKNGLVAKF
ncbi:aldo/keto reductase [Paenibacillus sp. GCM10027628]|uniref:aldo/keto reductase n=1 Tax=Paenibacillus sp. GCM10027628 TaxID=3273413 RepID=UPI00363E7814